MKRVLSVLAALAIATGLASGAAAQGTIRVAVGTTLNQLDPAKTTIGDEYIYVHLVFNGLTRIDRDLTTKPDLAVSWTASEDLKEWTFKLREGVKFHHGRTLDADDVVATVRRILDPATGSRARANLTMVEKVEAVDPLTVVHAQHSLCGLPGHLRRAPAPHCRQGQSRCAVHAAGRHRPVPVRLVGAGRSHGAGEEP
jgi:peptide/nickel transport system substrate-binding protein